MNFKIEVPGRDRVRLNADRFQTVSGNENFANKEANFRSEIRLCRIDLGGCIFGLIFHRTGGFFANESRRPAVFGMNLQPAVACIDNIDLDARFDIAE